jgi:hypothetical protein
MRTPLACPPPPPKWCPERGLLRVGLPGLKYTHIWPYRGAFSVLAWSVLKKYNARGFSWLCTLVRTSARWG